jgi:hypothetical protein
MGCSKARLLVNGLIRTTPKEVSGSREVDDLHPARSVDSPSSICHARSGSESYAPTWALTRHIALELAPFGIRVNAIARGLTEMISEPKLEHRDAQHYVGIRTLASIPELPEAIPGNHRKVYAWLKERGLSPSGPPSFGTA